MMTMSDRIYIHQIGDHVRRHFAEARESIVVISPFITVDLFENLAEMSKANKVVVVTSWRPDYLVQGYSDLSLYDCCRKHGWELRINNQIHAKMYLFDRMVLSIGSANCTGAGFGFKKKSNLEVMVDLEVTQAELDAVDEIVSCSLVVDGAKYARVAEWLESQPKQTRGVIRGYMLMEDGLSTESLPRTSSPEVLWKSATGDCGDADTNYIASVDETRFGLCDEDSYESFLESMKNKFDSMPIIQEFLTFVDQSPSGRRFGECKAWVRDHYTGSDYDYCMELTQVLYSWIPELYPRYQIWRPNYTQILYNCNIHNVGSLF